MRDHYELHAYSIIHVKSGSEEYRRDLKNAIILLLSRESMESQRDTLWKDTRKKKEREEEHTVDRRSTKSGESGRVRENLRTN